MKIMKSSRIVLGAILLMLLLLAVWLIISFIFNDGTDNIGDGYTYYPEQQFITGKHEIPPRVLEYKYKDEVIVVKQRPLEHQDIMYKDYNYFMGRDTLYYWIIEKKAPRIIGPLDYENFINRVSEYNDKRLVLEE